MLTFFVNVPVLVYVIFTIIVSLLWGIAFAIFAFKSGSKLRYIVEAIAGQITGFDSMDGRVRRRLEVKSEILTRTVLYFLFCIVAIALSAFGYQDFAYLAAVFGGVSVGIAVRQLAH